MAIPITCPSCRKSGTVPDLALGKTIRCPKCGHQFVVASAAPPMEPMQPMAPMQPMSNMSPIPPMAPFVPMPPIDEDMRTQIMLPESDEELLPPPPVVEPAPVAEMLDFDEPVSAPAHAPEMTSDDPFAFDYSPIVPPVPVKPVAPVPAKRAKPAASVAAKPSTPVAADPHGFDAFGDSPQPPDAMDMLDFLPQAPATVARPTPPPIAPAPSPVAPVPSAEPVDFDEPEPADASGNPFAVEVSAFGKSPEEKRAPKEKRAPNEARESSPKKWMLPAAIATCGVLLLVIIGLAIALSNKSSEPAPAKAQPPAKKGK